MLQIKPWASHFDFSRQNSRTRTISNLQGRGLDHRWGCGQLDFSHFGSSLHQMHKSENALYVCVIKKGIKGNFHFSMVFFSSLLGCSTGKHFITAAENILRTWFDSLSLLAWVLLAWVLTVRKWKASVRKTESYFEPNWVLPSTINSLIMSSFLGSAELTSYSSRLFDQASRPASSD